MELPRATINAAAGEKTSLHGHQLNGGKDLRRNAPGAAVLANSRPFVSLIYKLLYDQGSQ